MVIRGGDILFLATVGETGSIQKWIYWKYFPNLFRNCLGVMER